MKFRNRKEPCGDLPPQFDDTMSLMELANGEATLDLIYEYQYFQNDVSENVRGGLVTVHRTFNVPLPTTLTGIVYLKGQAIHVFGLDKDRKVVMLESKDVKIQPSSITLVNGQGYNTGILVMNWSEGVKANDIRLVMNYEYYIGDYYNEIY